MISVVKINSLLCALLLGGCASEATVPVQNTRLVEVPKIVTDTQIVDNSCAWVKLITVSPKDVLTPETAKQILTHDQTTVKKCPKVGTY